MLPKIKSYNDTCQPADWVKINSYCPRLFIDCKPTTNTNSFEVKTQILTAVLRALKSEETTSEITLTCLHSTESIIHAQKDESGQIILSIYNQSPCCMAAASFCCCFMVFAWNCNSSSPWSHFADWVLKFLLF